jgi:hypothetical protein
MSEVQAGSERPGALAHGHEVTFESYGVRLAVGANRADILEQARVYLPPGWVPCDPGEVQRRFEILEEQNGSYSFAKDGKIDNTNLSLELSVLLLDTEIRLYIARKAPEAIFVHAGVVAHGDRVIVLPGLSFAGKTRLVEALVKLGAHYYSDEFAVIDFEGLVHPYAKPLSLRDENQIQVDQSVESLGGRTGDRPLRIGAIAVTRYKPEAQWNPRRLSAGEGAMALLANTVPAQERPEESLRVIRRAVDGAVILESDRGEAGELAPILLAELDR